MSDKPQKKVCTIGPPPRKHATLDHWAGPMQHCADGMTTDPMRTPNDRKAGPKKTSGREPQTPVV